MPNAALSFRVEEGHGESVCNSVRVLWHIIIVACRRILSLATRDRQTDRQRARERDRDRDKDRQIGRQAGRQTETERDRDTAQRQTDRDRERQRQNSNSKTLFYKDSSLGSLKNLSNN